MFYQHGDLILTPVSTLPSAAVPAGSDVILEGEMTGHAHRIAGGEIRLSGDDVYVVVEDEADVTHEEHGTRTLPPGIYRRERVHEYDYTSNERFAVRTVRD